MEHPLDERARWLATWILPHEPALRRWLSRLAAPMVETDDIVQESYALLAGLPGVGHIRNPRAYLFTTARSVLLQQVRRARIVSIDSVAEIDGLCIQDIESPSSCSVSDHQQFAELAEHIARLPGKCREAFVLRKVHGYSQREIAERMCISESTVEKHIGKGLRLLMAAMAGEPAVRGGRSRSGRAAPAGHGREATEP